MQIHFILYIANAFYTIAQNKHKKSCFVNARILESFYEKGKKIKKENEKLANRKLGKVRNLGNLRKIILSFLISEFSILPYSQNRKLGFENLGKKFPRIPRFPIFWVFDLAVKLVNIFFWKLHVFKINMIFFSTVSFYLQKRFIKSKHEFFIKSIPKQTVEIFWNLILRNHMPYRLK